MRLPILIIAVILFGCGPQSKEARECDRQVNECMRDCDPPSGAQPDRAFSSQFGDNEPSCEERCQKVCSKN